MGRNGVWGWTRGGDVKSSPLHFRERFSVAFLLFLRSCGSRQLTGHGSASPSNQSTQKYKIFFELTFVLQRTVRQEKYLTSRVLYPTFFCFYILCLTFHICILFYIPCLVSPHPHILHSVFLYIVLHIPHSSSLFCIPYLITLYLTFYILYFYVTYLTFFISCISLYTTYLRVRHVSHSIYRASHSLSHVPLYISHPNIPHSTFYISRPISHIRVE